MKKKLFIHSIFTLIAALALVGCNLGGSSNYTPRLEFYNPASINTDSTLVMSFSADGIKFDSLHVNDTVTVFVLGNGIVNNLEKFNFSVTEPGDIDIIIPHDSVTRLFDPSSDFSGGKIVFPENTGGMVYPFKFVTMKPTSKTKINFLLQSDAQEVSNTSSIQLEFPIKP